MFCVCVCDACIHSGIHDGGTGPGGYSPHLMVGGGGMWPEKKYRGVRELLFIPKKGGVDNRNKHRSKAGVNGCRRQSWGRMREGVSPSRKGGGSGGHHPIFFCYLDALWCNLRHFEPKYKSSK